MVFSFHTGAGRNSRIASFALLAVIGFGSRSYGQAAAPPKTAPDGPVYNLSAAQWREDLRFMAEEMERRHANLHHTVSRERFKQAVADLHANIPTLQRHEIIV